MTRPKTAGLHATVNTMDVRHRGGERYEVTVRGHTIVVDQPAEAGGDDLAPTPVELFVASLATCVAFYVGRYLTRNGLPREELGVAVHYRMATDRPARVAEIHLTIRVPAALPAARWPGLQAVAAHCTVHNSLTTTPNIHIDLAV